MAEFIKRRSVEEELAAALAGMGLGVAGGPGKPGPIAGAGPEASLGVPEEPEDAESSEEFEEE